MNKVILLYVFLLLTTGIATASDTLNISFVHEMRYSGYYEDVKVADDFAYCTNGYGLVVLDVSDPEHPTEISHVPTPGKSICIVLKDTLCFLTESEAGLMIFNISDPENPELLGTCDEPRSAYWVCVDGDMAYVTNGDHVSETNVISVEYPTDPVAVTTFECAGGTKIAAHEGYCYISSYHGVYAFDVRDPELPEEVGFFEYENPNNNKDLTIHDGYLFAYCITNVLSIEDPCNMQVIGRYDRNHFGRSITFSDDLAFTWSAGVRAYNISDLNNINIVPRHYRIHHEVPPWDHSIGGTGSVYMHGYIIGCLGHVGMGIYDVHWAGEEPMELAACFSDPAQTRAILISDDYCYAAGDAGRFFVYSLENPREPELIRELNYWEEMERIPGYYQFYKIQTQDDLLFASTEDKMHIYSIENPDDPELLHSIHTSRGLSFEASGCYLYIASIAYGVLVYDISDPVDPVELDVEHPFQRTEAVALAGHYLISTHSRDGVVIWEILNDGTIRSISNLEISNNARVRSIAVSGDYAYISCSSPYGIVVVSIEDPEHPEEVNFVNVSLSNRLSIVGSFLYMTCTSEGIKVFSIEDPERPVLTGSINTPGLAREVAVNGDLVYVADRDDITIYDASRALDGWWLELPYDVHDFGEVSTDSSAEWELAFSNSSAIDREITDITIDNKVFACSFDTSFILPAESDTTLIVSFTPTADTTYTALLEVISGGHSVPVSLSGLGVKLDAAADEDSELPYEFALYEAYPNPFNSSVKINYSLDDDVQATLKIFDLSGREVAILANDFKTPGKHSAIWDAKLAPSGIYMCRLEVEGRIRTLKVTLIR